MLIQIRYIKTQNESGDFCMNPIEVLRFVDVSVIDFTADAFRYVIAGTNDLNTILKSNLIEIFICEQNENGLTDDDLVKSVNQLNKSIQKVD